ncbi:MULTISPECIES: DUF2065 family protein [Pseudomonas]|nr:DUF2065 family protein [Pseudomonas sp. MIL19]
MLEGILPFLGTRLWRDTLLQLTQLSVNDSCV